MSEGAEGVGGLDVVVFGTEVVDAEFALVLPFFVGAEELEVVGEGFRVSTAGAEAGGSGDFPGAGLGGEACGGEGEKEGGNRGEGTWHVS